MSKNLFHNDETRREAFVEVEGKVGRSAFKKLACPPPTHLSPAVQGSS